MDRSIKAGFRNKLKQIVDGENRTVVNIVFEWLHLISATVYSNVRVIFYCTADKSRTVARTSCPEANRTIAR